jgi:shikimate dehydrogenase
VIDGSTRLLVIVGDPIAHVRSPAIYNALLGAAGCNAVLVPWHAPADAVRPVMAGLMHTGNLAGIIVTHPFKTLALTLAHAVGPMAERVGAANVLRREADGRWSAEMFDGLGLVRAVAALGQRVVGRRVKLVGAGGAGSAIAHALAEAGAAALSIVDLDRGRAARLAQDIAASYAQCAVAAGDEALGNADLLINATPVGLTPGDGLPLPLPMLCAQTTVIDIVPRGETALLALARERTCPHAGGAAMVEGQAKAVLDFVGLTDFAASERAA